MTGHVRFTSLDIAAFGSWITVGFIDAVSQAMGGFFGDCPGYPWDMLRAVPGYYGCT
jgi:hypothetical protein